jgi:hypothetical protein
MKTKYVGCLALLGLAIVVRFLPQPPFDIAFARGDHHVGVSINVVISSIILGSLLLLLCIKALKVLLHQ